MRLFIGLGFLERLDLRLAQQQHVLRHLGSERFEAMLHRGKLVPPPPVVRGRPLIG